MLSLVSDNFLLIVALLLLGCAIHYFRLAFSPPRSRSRKRKEILNPARSKEAQQRPPVVAVAAPAPAQAVDVIEEEKEGREEEEEEEEDPAVMVEEEKVEPLPAHLAGLVAPVVARARSLIDGSAGSWDEIELDEKAQSKNPGLVVRKLSGSDKNTILSRRPFDCSVDSLHELVLTTDLDLRKR